MCEFTSRWCVSTVRAAHFALVPGQFMSKLYSLGVFHLFILAHKPAMSEFTSRFFTVTATSPSITSPHSSCAIHLENPRFSPSKPFMSPLSQPRTVHVRFHLENAVFHR